MNMRRWWEFLLIVFTLCNGMFVLSYRNHEDFPAFYGAAKMASAGDAGSLYNGQAQEEAEQRWFPNAQPRYFYHLAYEAWIFRPISNVAPAAAFFLWSGFSLLLLIGAALWLGTDLRAITGWTKAESWMVMGAFTPIAAIFVQGQDTMMLLLAVLAAYKCFELEKDLWDVAAGALLGLGLFKFQIILPLALLLAWRRPKLLLGFVPVSAAVMGISTELIGRHGWAAYWNLLWHREPEHVWRMINLRGVMETLGGKPWMTLLGSGALALKTVWYRPANARNHFAVCLTAALLVSYHLHLYDLSLLAIVLVPMIAEEIRTTGRWSMGPAAILLAAPLYLGLELLHALWILALVILWLYLNLLGEKRQRAWGMNKKRTPLVAVEG